jgi:hypothetical protein
MIRPKRWLPAIAATLLLAGGSAALTAGPAHAIAGPQICNVQNTNLCANARGGFHTPGDYVILWDNGDSNNTFQTILLSGICPAGGGVGAGYVHDGEGGIICPFANGSGLNRRYDKDAIVEFEDYTSALVYDPPLCIADSGTGSGSAALFACSWVQNHLGWGGATGSVFILSHITDINNMGITPFWAVNFHYTSAGVCGLNQPAWMVGATKGVPIYLNSCSANNQWFQAP